MIGFGAAFVRVAARPYSATGFTAGTNPFLMLDEMDVPFQRRHPAEYQEPTMKAKIIVTVLLALASATALSSAFADDVVAAQQGDGGGMTSQQQGEFPGMVCQGCH